MSAAPALPLLLVAACSRSASGPADLAVDELNYRSTAGQGFALSTDVTFKVAADIDAMETGPKKDPAIAAQAATIRITVTTALTAELDRIWPEEERVSGSDVSIEFRQATATFPDLKSMDGGLFGMTVKTEFAGIDDVEKHLPLETEDDKKFLPLFAISASVRSTSACSSRPSPAASTRRLGFGGAVASEIASPPRTRSVAPAPRAKPSPSSAPWSTPRRGGRSRARPRQTRIAGRPAPRFEVRAVAGSGEGANGASNTAFTSASAWAVELRVKLGPIAVLVAGEVRVSRGLVLLADDRDVLHVSGPFVGGSLGALF